MANILLIEPDKRLAEIYRLALESKSHRVVTCASAQAAIFAADDLTPDIVVLELQLIEHSGIEFLYEFRSYPEWQAIPALILSHVPPTEFNLSRHVLSNELGIRGYHYKPQTSLQRLCRAVNEYTLTST